MAPKLYGVMLSSRPERPGAPRRSRKDNQVNNDIAAAIKMIGNVCGSVTKPTTAPKDSAMRAGVFGRRRDASRTSCPSASWLIGFTRIALIPVFLLTACLGSDGAGRPRRPGTGRLRHVWVGPTGLDTASGTETAPFKTVTRALASRADVVHLRPGRHDVERLLVTRPVRIEGPATGRALVVGHVFVSADDVQLNGVDVGGGLAAHGVHGLTVVESRLASGSQDDTLVLTRTEANLQNLELTPGIETGIEVVNSTVSLSRVHVTHGQETKRGIRVDGSSLSATQLSSDAGKTARFQFTGSSRVNVNNLVDGGGEGNGLLILASSTVTISGARLASSTGFTVLVQNSRLDLSAAHIEGGGKGTVGVQGGRFEARTSTIGPSPGGALVVSAYRDRTADVTLIRSVVNHRAFDGARVSGGRLVARQTHFRGTPGDRTADGSAAIVHGPGASVEFEDVRIQTPAAYGLVLTKDVSARISGVIDRPGQSGLHIEGVRAEPTRLENLRVNDCGTGSGAVILDSDVIADRLSILRCPQAGVLAGAGSSVTVRNSRVAGPGRYGFAAFGDAALTIEDGQAREVSWAAFASCGEGARIIQNGKNKLEGPVTSCP